MKAIRVSIACIDDMRLACMSQCVEAVARAYDRALCVKPHSLPSGQLAGEKLDVKSIGISEMPLASARATVYAQIPYKIAYTPCHNIL